MTRTRKITDKGITATAYATRENHSEEPKRSFWVQVDGKGRWHQTSPANPNLTRCGLTVEADDDDRHEWLYGGALQCKRCWNAAEA